MLILVGIVAGVLIAVFIAVLIVWWIFDPLELLPDLLSWLNKIKSRKDK